MPKAYWIAHVGADNPENLTSDAYQAYVSGARPAFEEFGAKFLARGGEFVLAEGMDIGTRHVVIEFGSLKQARDCYNSPEYLEARACRAGACEASISIVEGC